MSNDYAGQRIFRISGIKAPPESTPRRKRMQRQGESESLPVNVLASRRLISLHCLQESASQPKCCRRSLSLRDSLGLRKGDLHHIVAMCASA